MIELQSPKNNAHVILLREKHLAYIEKPRNDPTSKVDWLALREVQDDLSFPEPLLFSFDPPLNGEIFLRDESGKTRVIHATEGKAFVQNLRIDTEYKWFVRVGTACSEEYSFHTDAQVPRMLFVDGITNVRDFGGFHTGDGNIIRQDLIYRTSELDSHVAITEEGIATLEKELRIHTDLDVRGINDEPRCPILNESLVNWVNIPLAAYDKIFSDEQRKRYGESYKLLTNPDNYPFIVHCWGGIDRTGTWLYILGGMLGVSEDDLGLDYEMSSFTRWGRRSRFSEQFLDLRKGLFTYGETLKDACTSFMKACGLTDEELHAIQNILLK